MNINNSYGDALVSQGRRGWGPPVWRTRNP